MHSRLYSPLCSLIRFALAIGFGASLAAAAPSASELLQRETLIMLEAAQLGGNEGKEFSRTFLGLPEWQHALLDSGPVADLPKAVQILFAIWQKDPAMNRDPIRRQMATACAIEGSSREDGLAYMLPRYEFFTSKWEAGLLNSNYENLSVFERRFLARGVQHSGFNTIESMEFHNAEVSLPAERYTGACWYARYELNNPFGDSIHGPLYYTPFHDSWSSYAEVVRNVGGVCGSLSNFGAAAAIANGIPAVTMGEPGHCAYAVLTSPKNWVPAYSLSWQRGLHTSFFGNSWSWHAMTTRAQENIEASRKSGDLRRLAEDHLKHRRPSEARRAIQLARVSQPLDAENWAQSIAILKATQGSHGDWQALHQDLVTHLAPVSGEIAYHYLKSAVYDEVLPKGPQQQAVRRNILLSFHHALADWGVSRWDYSSAVKEQLAMLSDDVADQDQFMAELFNLHAKNNIFTGEILSAQMNRVGDDQKRFQGFIATIGRSLSQTKGGQSGDVIDSLAATLLPAAAARGDKATFQFIGKLTAKNYPALSISPKKFPGILLSSGGTFSIEKPGNRWDNPSRHWGVIEEHGGDFHTDTTPATATVMLGNFGRISGVVIVAREGHVGRLNGAILETSTDGEKWTGVHHFANVSRVQRIDLADQNITAGYVRVIHPDHGSLHFHQFLVYGQKQN